MIARLRSSIFMAKAFLRMGVVGVVVSGVTAVYYG
jgi:hypothetical protein